MNEIVAVIPARYGSTRFPGKPLADIGGKPMVVRVLERAKQAKGISRVIVATDDERILRAVQSAGGEAMMTDPELASGTDRVAAIADQVPAQFYVNVQGDEPLLDPRAIEQVAELVTSKRFEMSSLMAPLRTAADLASPHVVKVMADIHDRALFFTRHPIPYSRQLGPNPGESYACRRHLGIYAYSRDLLFRLRKLPLSPWELGESLEQLRALQNGIAIGIREFIATSGDAEAIGVDTPADLEKVRAIFAQKS